MELVPLGASTKTERTFLVMDNSKIETTHTDDGKRDALVQEAEQAIHGVEVSLVTDPDLKAEMPPFFSKECLKVLFACAAGYFSTTLYGYDVGNFSLYLLGLNVRRSVRCQCHDSIPIILWNQSTWGCYRPRLLPLLRWRDGFCSLWALFI